MMLPKIVVLAFEGINPFHLAVPALVFGDDRTADGIPRYTVETCSVDHHLTMSTTAGYRLVVDADLSAIASADRIIVPSWQKDRPVPPGLRDAIQTAHKRGAEIIGLCLGAFPLAEMGLLDGRIATTHWRYAEEFQKRFPQVLLDSHVLWVDNGDVVTSAVRLPHLIAVSTLCEEIVGPMWRIALPVDLSWHHIARQARRSTLSDLWNRRIVMVRFTTCSGGWWTILKVGLIWTRWLIVAILAGAISPGSSDALQA